MPALEFSLASEDILRLSRWPGVRSSRSFATEITWFDTPDSELAAGGKALVATGGQWQMQPLRSALPATVGTVLATARRRELIGISLPEGLTAVARLNGRRQALRWTEHDQTVALTVLAGWVAAGSIGRVTLEGPGAALAPLAAALAGGLGLTVPRWSLAHQALAMAQGEVPPPRALGAPQVPEGLPVSGSLSVIIGHLLDVMVHWAAHVAAASTPEPVHQMRVATRRLRSALSIYKQAAPCPEIASLGVLLKLCADRLGTARDWDVFLDGLGARLAQTFPDDTRCTRLLHAAARRRTQAYADLRIFLEGPDFRVLSVALACAAALRPWDAGAALESLQQDTLGFAAKVLARRMKQVRAAGRGIETLSIPALHELRKDCKRLRYAAEFFAPLFQPRKTRRFVQKLADLQEELGLLNDTAAVSGLMAQLGRMERSYAAGLVEGFSAAHAGTALDRIIRSWRRFKAVETFWPG